MPPTYVDANRLWVDSRIRYEIGLRVEGAILQRLGAHGQRAVEIGTGRRGLGTRVAVERLGATDVTAFDLYPATVGRARIACADLGERVAFRVGDATALPVDDASVDLVVDFHALHHIADWRAAVAEAARVLRPGGQLALTEMTARFVDAPLLRAVSRHPADRFSTGELLAELRAHGLEVPAGRLRRAAGDRWIQAVATRT
ncbi:methyltransferase family protein [Geodermatophilus normandii]|uniref:Methyltransferase family protein n=1 Tax=Geodermatophilus normandii TaxID=1137989 RepID=A0A317QMQ2_9ACTN|nr:methyltransferase family protein [Geodermatophilus normandii]